MSREKLTLLSAYAPGVKITDNTDLSSFVITHIESDENCAQQKYDELIIKTPWDKNFEADLPHLLYSVARNLWLERGLYSAHAACVGNKLLPGHSGTGKSSTALALATTWGQRIYSGNTTLLDFSAEEPVRAIAGTKVMTLNSSDFDETTTPVQSIFSYGNRIAFELEDSLMTEEAEIAVNGIILVKLTSGSPSVKQLEPTAALHALYGHLLDVEYADCILANGKIVYAVNSSTKARQNLAQKLAASLETTPVHQITGSKEFVASEISHL